MKYFCSTAIASVFFLSSGVFAETPAFRDLEKKADQWVMQAVNDLPDAPADIVAALVNLGSSDAMLEIYGQNWTAVTAQVDDAVSDLTYLEIDKLGDPVRDINLGDLNSKAMAAFSQHEGTLLTMRLFEPETLASLGYSMVLGTSLAPEDLASNSVLGGVLSERIFRTEWNGQPAVGLTQGLWTAVTIYSRSQHGLLVPQRVSLFVRKAEN
ncbi:hypothetical protein [Roseibium sediminicola]|uniref:Uncharacterized protein n=1 Tax=Roseibium sediminicola TaxID=2933272 RepID=A0ABT0H008_9HYPH|nr:hypothetical protein [Roseibium sp. CAU 1639]MCK7615024.1 hypothetical protein [Roseibium sp. CAU 1639]